MKTANQKKEIVIGKKKSLKTVILELIQYKELIYIFAWRDIKLKYRQTVLGFAWVILQPLLMMLIFTSIFSNKIGSIQEGFSYPVYVFSGLMIYNLFSNTVSSASNSLLFHSDIIKKNYFPRIILPTSSILVSAFDFFISLLVLAVMLLMFQDEFVFFRFVGFSLSAFLLTVIPTLGIGVLLSALNVRYRDIKFVIPFFLMIMLFISPIIYPIDLNSTDLLQMILKINPLSASIELMKSAINPNYTPSNTLIAIGLGISLVIFCFALLIFNRIQKTLTDIL